MKKKITKLLCVLMMFVLAMSLIACGSKKDDSSDSKKDAVVSDKKSDNGDGADKKEPASASGDITVEELFENMTKASEDLEGVTGKASFVLDMEAAGESMKIGADMNIEANTQPLEAHVDMNLDLESGGQTMSMDYELYEIEKDDTIKLYMNMYDRWMYQEQEFDKDEYEGLLEEAMGSLSLEDFNFDDLSDVLDKAELTLDGDEYSLELEMSLATLLDVIDEAGLTSELETMLDEELNGMELSDLPDVTVSFALKVNADTFLPSSMSFKITMGKLEVDGESLEIKDLHMDIEYTSYDKVSIEVPEEALEAETNGSQDMDFSDLY